MTGSTSRGAWVGIAAAAAAVVVIGLVVAAIWVELGDAGMSGSGWTAMVLGIVATLALGCGLMALVFISNRRGYDDPHGPQP